MTKTEKFLKLASLSNKERKARKKDKNLDDVVIKKFSHGTYICTHHLGQNGSLTSKICNTLTTCDCGHVIVEDKDENTT
jgi:hypothetical protein